MDKPETSPKKGQLTQHAMLVIWGAYAQQIGLVRAIEEVELSQKKRDHGPQTKVIEFLLAILGGLPHLQDLSRSAHPLVKDKVVAEAWGQAGWADYSGVSRTLQTLNDEETQALIEAVKSVSQPYIEQECERAVSESGYLVYDADLTGRPVSSTSTSYPDTAFGHMGDTIRLGYQAALVSLHSPSYGRLWLANQLHPGDTVSATQAQALVLAAEASTSRHPRRRTELVAQCLSQAEAEASAAAESYEASDEKHQLAQDKAHDTKIELAEWSRELRSLEAEYKRHDRQPTAHCKLARARRKVTTYELRLPRVQKKAAIAQRRLERCKRKLAMANEQVARLRHHHQHLMEENETNAYPVRALFRLDAGFASAENIAWLIEMGYDVDTKARSTKVREGLLEAVTPDTEWQQVGGNAMLTATLNTTANGYFTYPVDLALARYHTGKTLRHSVLVHYSDVHDTSDLHGWFHRYNGRQTIEAGIKENKNVFQMHHLKVRSPNALLLQEYLASFAANFVRLAALWLTQQQQLHEPALGSASVKQMVRVCAHTSAWVQNLGDVWLLTFTDQSLFAGLSIRIGIGYIQLPLPLFRNVHFCHF